MEDKNDEILLSPKQSENDVVNSQVSEKVRKIRETFLEHKKPQLDRFGDGFVAQASSQTGSNSSIAKALGLDALTFQYYMEKYPDFVSAVQLGRLDGRKERLAELESSLMARALGVEIEETKTEESGPIDEDGNFRNSYKKVTTYTKQIPPDPQAALEILRRIDPNWNPKATIDVNMNNTFAVTEDVNINVDLRTLSPETLREILNSNKKSKNWEVSRTPDGESVRFLADKTNLQKKDKKKKKENPPAEEKPKDKSVTVKKRIMSPETRAKISQALKKRNEEKRGDTDAT